jgi:hypothetical protein
VSENFSITSARDSRDGSRDSHNRERASSGPSVANQADLVGLYAAGSDERDYRPAERLQSCKSDRNGGGGGVSVMFFSSPMECARRRLRRAQINA